MTGQPRTGVLYLGWVGQHNLGDEALALAARQALPGPMTVLPPLRAAWLSEAPRLVPTGRRRHLMLGGGTTIGRAPWRRALSLHGSTTARRAPWLMLGAGVEDPSFSGLNSGSEGGELTRWLALLERFAAVTVRGPRSAELLADLGVDARVVGDPALLLAPAHTASHGHESSHGHKSSQGHGQPTRPDLVGVNLGFGDDVWGHDHGPIVQAAAELIAWLLGTGRQVLLLVVNPADRPIAEQARAAALARLPATATSAVRLTQPATVEAYLQAVGECALVVGDRLHSVVLAAAAGTPVVSLEYQPKCRDFMDSLDAADRCLRVDRLGRGELVDRVAAVLDDVDAVAAHDRAAVARLRGLLEDEATRLRALLTAGQPPEPTTAPPPDTPRTRRIAARDRLWGSTQVAGVIGPLDPPDPPALRAVLSDLGERTPDHRVVSQVNRRGSRWQPVTASLRRRWLAAHVVESDTSLAERGVGPLLEDLLGRRVTPGGFRLVVGTDYVGLSGSHLLGDVWLLNDLLTGVVLSATAVTPLPDRLTRDDESWPLVRSLVRFWMTHPSQVIPLLATARYTTLLQGVHLPRPPRAVNPGSGGLPAVTHIGGDDRRPTGQTRPAVVFARSDTAAVRDLDRWRRAHPGTSAMAVHISLAERALQTVGLAPATPRRTVLVDARRYLPPRAHVTGNFVVGQGLTLADWTDPMAVSALLDRVLDAGRPLVTLACVSAWEALRGGMRRWSGQDWPATAASAPADPGLPEMEGTLTYSVLGALPGTARLAKHAIDKQPFVTAGRGNPAPGRPAFGIGTSADGPRGLTVTILHFDGALQVSIGFCEPHHDTAQVQRAADVLCADPVGLLDSPLPSRIAAGTQTGLLPAGRRVVQGGR